MIEIPILKAKVGAEITFKHGVVRENEYVLSPLEECYATNRIIHFKK